MRVHVHDDLRRSRLTTAFRLILALPHLVWLSLWGSIMLLLLPVQWVATLIKRRPIEGLQEVYEQYVRYSLHVYAYLFLAANPFPPFLGEPGRYPIDFERMPVEEQSRRSVAFRGFLALPPFFMAGALGSAVITSAGSAYASFSLGPAWAAAFLGWFAVLARGAMPAGFRDVAVYGGGYALQVAAYFFLVTGRFPDTNPERVPLVPRPPYPVRLRNEDDPRRSRVTVLFRAILALPHYVWWLLWGIVAILVSIGAWLAGIVLGRVPRPLHRFLARYVRYGTHVIAFYSLTAGPFPGFTGLPASYPIDVELPEPERQSRWSIGFRGLLAFPALLMAGGLSTAQSAASIGAWFYSLWTGRMPTGVHALLVYSVRYITHASAYALLLTPRYPHSGPSEEEREPSQPSLEPPPDDVFATAPEMARPAEAH